MAEPTTVNPQITDAIVGSAAHELARSERRYVLARGSLSVELGWDSQRELARLHVAFVDHEAPCPFVPSGTRLPLTLAHTLELGDTARTRALATWLARELDIEPRATQHPPTCADGALLAHSLTQGHNTASLEWDPHERCASLALRCIELPVHVFNDGFSAHSCRVSASFELPVSRPAAVELCTWLSAVTSVESSH